MKTRNVKMIKLSDWDDLIETTYKRQYSFQQQDNCQPRGIFQITIPSESRDEEMHDEIPEKVNGDVMGVKFSKWLERDPKMLVNGEGDYMISLFWERNFYPDIYTVANDLHNKGLIEAGDYVINIDW